MDTVIENPLDGNIYDRLNVYYFVEGHAHNNRPRLARTASETISEALSAGDDALLRRRGGMSEEEVLDFLKPPR